MKRNFISFTINCVLCKKLAAIIRQIQQFMNILRRLKILFRIEVIILRNLNRRRLYEWFNLALSVDWICQFVIFTILTIGLFVKHLPLRQTLDC